jgi:hypothetical protein
MNEEELSELHSTQASWSEQEDSPKKPMQAEELELGHVQVESARIDK